MASTVFIWNNNVAGLTSYPGHASLAIGNPAFTQFNNDQSTTFVSWMPGNGASHSAGKDAGRASMNIFRDLKFEGYAPDHVIHIPTTIAMENLMRAHWAALRIKTVPDADDARPAPAPGGARVPAPSYDFLWKNCSRMVQRVLKAGDISMSLNPLQWNLHRKHTIWTPLDVKDLALSYSGARTIPWFDWVQQQALTVNEKTLLTYYQKRHARHGSSGAPSRNSAAINTRLLHALPYTRSSSGYKNTAITAAIELFSNPAARVYVRLKGPPVIGVGPVGYSFADLIRALNTRDYRYLQN